MKTADEMSIKQFNSMLHTGFEQAKRGKSKDANLVFAKLREKTKYERHLQY